MALGFGLAALPLQAQQAGTPPDSTLNPWASPYCQMMTGSWSMMGGNPGAMMRGYPSMMGGNRGATMNGHASMMGGSPGAVMHGANGMMESQSPGLHMGLEARGMMLQATRLWPAYLVSQRQELGLTDAQVLRLQALTDQQPISAEQRSAILETQDRLAEAFDQSDSTTMVRQAQELGREYGELQAHQFEIAAQARNVLTPQQRKLLASQPAACRMWVGGETHAGNGSGATQSGRGPGPVDRTMHH